jgi:hypothetical protein
MVNVVDPRAWAFTTENPVDRSDTFRLQFPFDVDADSYPVYKNETGVPYTSTRAAEQGTWGQLAPGVDVHADDAVQFDVIEPPQPITDAYRQALTSIVNLPDSLTIEQIAPILARAGVDLTATLGALTPVIDPTDLETLLTLSGQPVALSYVDGFEGSDVVDRYTGGIIAVTDVTETISAVPDPQLLTALQAILDKYPQVPEAVTASGVIASGGLAQIPVFTNQYHQTPASIADVYGEIRDLGDQRRLAEVTVPRVLRIAGVVLLVLGAVLVTLGLVRRRRAEPAA